MTVPLTPVQKRVVAGLAVLCAASRFLALSRSLWEWDEVLFCLGMDDYDVSLHQPHPPGFPIFIGLARLLRLVAGSDFRALQAISLLAAFLVFPAVYLLARELRFGFQTAVSAATLFAFSPNVWFFGGTAYSDVPSIVLVVFAVFFLLRGRDSRRAYWTGTFLLALAIGIRPQNLLVGLFPGAVATFRRPWREVVVAILIGVTIVGAAYGAAAYATGGVERYMSAIRAHGDYISSVDSFRSPERPPLWRLFDRFFVKIYQSTPLGIVMSLFVAGSIVGAIRARDRRLLENFLIFAPFALSAWLMLDRFSISRFSIGYAPMFTLFAADGIQRFARGHQRTAGAIAAVLVGAFVIWTAPALSEVRRNVSPPVQAIETVRQNFDPRKGRLFVGYTLTRFVDYLAPGLPYARVLDDRGVPLSDDPGAFVLAEVTETPPAGFFFSRPRGRLWNIARRHYFEIVFKPVSARPQFGAGWYPAERGGHDEWRWMGATSHISLPAAEGDTILRLRLSVPRELLSERPEVVVTLNGRVLERIRASSDTFQRDYEIEPVNGPNVLRLSTSRTFRSADGRELGIRLGFLAWGPR